MTLHALHRDELLILPNVWDAFSARLVESAGARAIATASAAVAWREGYADGELAPLDLHVRTTVEIARVVRLPISVDLERGYSDDPEAVADAVERVLQAGAAGVNLEDAAGDPVHLANKIRSVRQRLGDRVFVNARTCLVLRGHGVDVTEILARARLYAEAGADGFFVPRLAQEEHVRAIARGTPLALNLLLDPALPAPSVLAEWGVRRLSAGPYLARAAYSAARHAAQALLGGTLHGPALAAELTFAEANALLT